MFRSLGSRLVLAFSGVILVGMFVAGVALMFLLRGYQNRLTEARLRDVSGPLFVRVTRLAESGARGLPAARLAAFIESQASDLNVAVLLLDATGRVRIDSSEAQSFLDHRLDLPDPSSLTRTDGSIHSGSFRAPDVSPWVYTASRLQLLDGNEARPAILVLTTPTGTLAGSLSDLVRILAFAGAIALLAAALLSAFLSRSLARPLRRLERATDAVAQGDYDLEAPVEGAADVRHLAQSFNQMTRRVKAARDLQRTFLASVSHELRTPLTSIQGFSQAIVEGAITDEAGFKRAGHIINEGAQRLIRMVEELLDLARIESGQEEFHAESVDLAGVADRAIDVFEIRAAEAGVEIVRRIGPMPGVMGNPDRLEQVLTNLIDNAIRHTPKGGKVEVRGGASDDEWAELSVRDTGPGLRPQDLERVFERFEHGPEGGAGLGLAIAREVVRVHGGSLRAESPPGSGAVFTMRLPRSS